MILLASIQSTGTRFATELLNKTGYRFESYHIHHNSIGVIETKGVGRVCVFTMRHPIRLAESWLRRYWRIDLSFYLCLYALFYLQRELNGLWLPIDTPDRDEYVDTIAHRIGVPLSTDWTPVGQSPDREVELLAEEVEHIRNLPLDFAQFGYRME